ncbi:MAG TPA: Gmad2 immunoglobulin-like domain-containing protein [Jiangellaceae bacterium]|nr:Gmad2 immunoglobulin-like domain-containing protein [Jiangellaceae bacterium]
MTTGDDWPQQDELLRRALHDEAAMILPSPDALARIRARTARTPLWRSPLTLGMAAAVATATAVIAGGIAVLGDSTVDTTATDGPAAGSTTGSETPSAVATDPSPAIESGPPTESAPPTSGPEAETATVPVYYVAETPAGQRLAREFRTVPTPDGPLVAAVEAMISVPPGDPQYQTLWASTTEVRRVDVAGDVIEVDLTDGADYTGAAPDVAELATQQLVYTVTAAASMTGAAGGALPVQILVEGERTDRLWGSIDIAEPVQRADPLAVRQLVQINEPAEGAVVTGPAVEISGEAVAFEANVPWQIFRDGELVVEDFTTARECCTFSPFSFTVELEPGAYEVVVTEDDPSGGEGRPPMSDSRSFRVE